MLPYKFAAEISPATTALENKQGDCEELTSLVIAFCRVHKIPARSVWVPATAIRSSTWWIPAGKGHWYPCQAAGGSDDFGRECRRIAHPAKGDSFKIPGEKEPRRYQPAVCGEKRRRSRLKFGFISKRIDKADASRPAAALVSNDFCHRGHRGLGEKEGKTFYSWNVQAIFLFALFSPWARVSVF